MTTKPKRGKVFVARVARFKRGVRYSEAMSGTFDPGVIAEKVLPNLKGGQLFAYLFRRFGYPSVGWDDYKELVNYHLTTPVPGVFLVARPYMGGDPPSNTHDCAGLMFGYCITQAIQDEFYDAMRHSKRYGEWEETPRYQEIVSALEATIRDLLRPVYVRDVAINCYGRLDDRATGLLPAAKYSPMAGYPIPEAFFADTDRWEAFCDALGALGKGDVGRGMRHVIALASAAEENPEGSEASHG